MPATKIKRRPTEVCGEIIWQKQHLHNYIYTYATGKQSFLYAYLGRDLLLINIQITFQFRSRYHVSIY